MELISPISTRPRVPNARIGLLMTGLIVLAVGVAFARTRQFEWFVLKSSLRANFPNVRWISTEELARDLANREQRPPLLLDVRTEAEWDVSHLPNARRVEPGASADVAAGGVAHDMPIVTYCAVGYRSGALANRLRSAGFTNVRNLEGSIFTWANEHRPLVRDTETARLVHPFSAWWGRLLADDVRAPLIKTATSR